MKDRAIKIPNWLLCLIVSLPLLSGMLWEYYPLMSLDMKIYDKLSQIRLRDMPSPVVIVEIDRKSIKQLGPWPWPRSYMATIVSTISKAKAAVIGLNILYEDRDLNPALGEINSIRKNLKDSQLREGEIQKKD